MAEATSSIAHCQAVLDRVLECLECPVCNYYYEAPIEMCLNGHSICTDCKNNGMTSCPICQAKIGKARNYLLEHIIETGINDIELDLNEQFEKMVIERVQNISKELDENQANFDTANKKLISMGYDLAKTDTEANLLQEKLETKEKEILQIKKIGSVTKTNLEKLLESHAALIEEVEKKHLETEKKLEDHKILIEAALKEIVEVQKTMSTELRKNKQRLKSKKQRVMRKLKKNAAAMGHHNADL